MLFNSIEFLIFFPLVALLYFLAVKVVKKNWLTQVLLLASSLYFYASWKPAYLALILISVVITWASGLLMQGQTQRRKKAVLALSLISNLAILFFFKYYNFFNATMGDLFGLFGHTYTAPAFNVLLPVGISFYTFQALGYSMDVYRGRLKAEHNIFTYTLFVTFFPQLVAGPIERTGHLLPQFRVNHDFDYKRVTDGLILAAWGLLKKVVIADRLAVYVNAVFSDVSSHNGITLLAAVYLFTFQILCDFAGYSDIAIGISKILGFDLMVNFRRPFFSKTIGEFWRRWHISLNTWFRDYLLMSLKGKRGSVVRKYLNPLLTLLISGLWHGANWTFIAWGGLIGVYMIFGTVTENFRHRMVTAIGINPDTPAYKKWKIFVTFTLVSFTGIFFRSRNIRDALYVFTRLWTFPVDLVRFVKNALQGTFTSEYLAANLTQVGHIQFTFMLFLCVLLLSADYFSRRDNGLARYRSLPVAIRWSGYYIMMFAILFLGVYSGSQFIYFQF